MINRRCGIEVNDPGEREVVLVTSYESDKVCRVQFGDELEPADNHLEPTGDTRGAAVVAPIGHREAAERTINGERLCARPRRRVFRPGDSREDFLATFSGLGHVVEQREGGVRIDFHPIPESAQAEPQRTGRPPGAGGSPGARSSRSRERRDRSRTGQGSRRTSSASGGGGGGSGSSDPDLSDEDPEDGPQPFAALDALARRYRAAFACLAEAHAPYGLFDGDWQQLALEARDRVEHKLLPDPILDYERPPKRPRQSTSATATGRVEFDASDDPLKNGDLLRQYLEAAFGTEVSRSGMFRCIDPQHEDVHASAKMWPDGRWKCFACGASGDVIDAAAYATGRQPTGPDYWWLRDHVLEVLLRAPLPSERGQR